MPIQPNIFILDIETIDSVDAEHAPVPIPCIASYDVKSDTYHVFCHGFKPHETAQVKMRLYQYWTTNLIPKLIKYNFSNPKIVFHSHESERNQLGDLISTRRQLAPDIIAVWNKTFDMPYTINRMKGLNLPYQALSETNKVYYNSREEIFEMEGLVYQDAMTLYADMQLQELRSKSLDFCANREFGIGKMKRVSIKEMLEKDRVGLLAYNLVDVQLTYALIMECQLMSQQMMLSKLANVGLDNISPLQLVDAFTMSFLRDRKIALPTNKHIKIQAKKKGKSDNTGGAVHEASVGKHKNIIILDYKGMYPSLMMSGNMCASTYITVDEIRQTILGKTIGDKRIATLDDINNIILEDVVNKFYIHAPNSAHFRKDIQGIIPEILAYLKSERNKYKKLEKDEKDSQQKNIYYLIQYGYKVIMNIFYGMFKNKHFRLMNKELAEAVTSMGRTLIQRTLDIIENKVDISSLIQVSHPELLDLIDKLRGHKLYVKYSDTDSTFVKLPDSLNPEEMIIVGKVLEQYLNSIIPDLAKELFNIDKDHCVIEIEFDDKKIMTSFMQVPSKVDKTRGAKKRYVYLSYNQKTKSVESEPHFVGMDVIRSDTAPLMSEIQISVSKMLLTDEPYEKIRQYLLDKHKNFQKNQPENLLIKETFGDQFEDYISHSPQIIGAMYANKYLSKNFRQGASAYYIYLKSLPSGYPQHIQTKWGLQQVVALCLNYNESVPPNFINHIDWDKMRELVVEKPVETLLEAVGYKWSDILSGTKTNKIKSIVIQQPSDTPKTLNNNKPMAAMINSKVV